MGTHSIFESDFDCLTEMLSRTTRIILRNYFQRNVDLFAKSVIKYRMEHPLVTRFDGDVLYKKERSPFTKTPSDEDLASVTKIALQGLVNALGDEDSDMTKMFCPQNPMLENETRKQWKWLTPNDKIFLGKEIFKDCEIFVRKFVDRDDQQYFMAFIWSEVSKLPERYQDLPITR